MALAAAEPMLILGGDLNLEVPCTAATELLAKHKFIDAFRGVHAPTTPGHSNFQRPKAIDRVFIRQADRCNQLVSSQLYLRIRSLPSIGGPSLVSTPYSTDLSRSKQLTPRVEHHCKVTARSQTAALFLSAVWALAFIEYTGVDVSTSS